MQYYKQINVSVTLLEKLNWLRKSYKPLHQNENSQQYPEIFKQKGD